MAKLPNPKTPLSDLLADADKAAAYSETPLTPVEPEVPPEMQQAIFEEDEPEGEVAPPTPQPMAEDGPSPVELASMLAVQFGPTNEFSERRIARLRDEQEEIRREVLAIDQQIEHLNARRTNAMLAFSGVSADLTALGVHD